MRSNLQVTKRERKTSLFFREISSMIQTLSLDEPKIAKVFVTRVRLSNDYGICYVYFSSYLDQTSQQDFFEALDVLKLYKSSLRSALAKIIGGRYATDLIFLYDDVKDKERKINKLLDQVSQEEDSSDQK